MIGQVEREIAIETYRALVRGNLAGIAVALGMDDDQIGAALNALNDVARDLVTGALGDPHGKIFKSVARGRERPHFIGPRT